MVVSLGVPIFRVFTVIKFKAYFAKIGEASGPSK